MLKIYNNNNSMNVSYVQQPDWELLNINKREDKLNLLNQMAEQSIDKPIVDKKNNPIGIITNAIVDEVGLYILFEGLLFGYLSLNFNYNNSNKSNESDNQTKNEEFDYNNLEFSSTAIDFKLKHIKELLDVNEKFKKLLYEREEEKKKDKFISERGQNYEQVNLFG